MSVSIMEAQGLTFLCKNSDYRKLIITKIEVVITDPSVNIGYYLCSTKLEYTNVSIFKFPCYIQVSLLILNLAYFLCNPTRQFPKHSQHFHHRPKVLECIFVHLIHSHIHILNIDCVLKQNVESTLPVLVME